MSRIPFHTRSRRQGSEHESQWEDLLDRFLVKPVRLMDVAELHDLWTEEDTQ